MGQPSWAAEVGIPLLVTLLGIGAAYLFLSRQIQHDPALRRADRQAAIMGRLGRDVARYAGHMDAEDGIGDYWLQDEWPEWSAILESIEEARPKIPGEAVYNEILSIARDLLWAWKACALRRHSLLRDGVVIDRLSHYLALEATIHPLKRWLVNSAEALQEWDGFGAAPVPIPTNLLHLPLPPKKRADKHRSWLAYYANQYESNVRRQVTEHPEHATKYPLVVEMR